MEINSISELDISTFGLLKGVWFDPDTECENTVTNIIFEFSNIKLEVFANIADDSICLFASDINAVTQCRYNQSKRYTELINSIISKQVLWIWELINQQGYRDGLQIEFFDRCIGVTSNVIIQLIVAASIIKVYIVIPRSWNDIKVIHGSRP